MATEEEDAYRQLLLRPEWTRKRNEIVRRSPRCKRCGRKGGRLEVHHPYYDYGRMPWDYPDEDYEVVCHGRCHREADEDRVEQEARAKSAGGGWQWEEGRKHRRPNQRETEKLAKYEKEFLTWLRREEIVHDHWSWDVFPLWFLWNQKSKKFLAERHGDDQQGRLAL